MEKIVNSYHIYDKNKNITELDYREMSFYRRLKIALGILFYGKVIIKWKKMEMKR